MEEIAEEKFNIFKFSIRLCEWIVKIRKELFHDFGEVKHITFARQPLNVPFFNLPQALLQ